MSLRLAVLIGLLATTIFSWAATVNNIYLTIDDAPSSHLTDKINFLSEHHIPAIFFCRGEFLEKNKPLIIDAIQKGFIIGNHSYTHPYFSQTSLDVIYEEIQKTEDLIEECYQQAHTKRPYKLIRLPFGDRGAGANAKEASTNEEKIKVQAIQEMLRSFGFVPLHANDELSNFVDVYWDWDTEDYREILKKNPGEYLLKLILHWENASKTTQMILMHDFEDNQHLFDITMKFLMEKNTNFLSFTGM